MKKTPALIMAAFLASASFLHAQLLFQDDFNRANTAGPNGGLGSNYNIAGNLFINDDQAYTQSGTQNVGAYNGFSLSGSFTISADLLIQTSAGGFTGIAFNYNLSTNSGLAFRMNADGYYQLVSIDSGGGLGLIDQGTIAGLTLPTDTYRRFTLSSTGTADVYSAVISSTDGSVVYGSTTVTDSSHLGISGAGGIYQDGGFKYADNLSIATVPEPNTVILFGAATAGVLFFVRRRSARA